MLRKLLIAALCVAALGLGWRALTQLPSGAAQDAALHAPGQGRLDATDTGQAKSAQESQRQEVDSSLEAPIFVASEGAIEGAIVEIEVHTLSRHDGALGNTSVDQPAPSVRFRIGLSPSHYSIKNELATGTTDANGVAIVQLSKRQLIQTRGRLVVQIAQPGYLAEVSSVMAYATLKPTDGERFVLKAFATRGTTLSGQLRGPNGWPIQGEIDAYFLPEGTDSKWLLQSSSSANQDGTFEVAATREGTYNLVGKGRTADLQALRFLSGSHFVLGTGSTGTLEVSFDKPLADLDIQTAGRGLLQGVLLHGDGTPAAEVEIEVSSTLITDESGIDAELATTATLQARGLTHVTQKTNSLGRFYVHGLREGSYFIRARTSEAHTGFPVLLTPSAIPSDSPPLQFQIDIPQIAVHLIDSTGAPHVQPVLMSEEFDWDWENGGPIQARSPKLVVAPIAAEARLAGTEFHPVVGLRTTESDYVFDVRDGANYVVGLQGPGILWQPIHVAIPRNSGRVDVDLIVPAPVPEGTLGLRVSAPSGEALIDNLQVFIMPVGEGPAIYRRTNFYDNGAYAKAAETPLWPLRVRLPEGEWRVVVQHSADLDLYHGTVITSREYGGSEQTIRISGGQETPVAVTLSDAAKLEVCLKGVATPADLAEYLKRNPGQIDATAKRAMGYAQLTLYSQLGTPHPVHFEEIWGSLPNAEIHLATRLAMGQTKVSEALTPGQYTLVARLASGREVSKEVALVPGETTKVTLTFD